MAVGSITQTLYKGHTTEVPRFPGWTLHIGLDIISGDIVLRAVRKSDQRTLQYREHLVYEREYPAVIDRLLDKLGGDFLDLVPLAD